MFKMDMGIVKIEKKDEWLHHFVSQVEDPCFTPDNVRFDGKYIYSPKCPFYYQVAILRDTDDYKEISYIKCPSFNHF